MGSRLRSYGYIAQSEWLTTVLAGGDGMVLMLDVPWVGMHWIQ